MDKTTHQRLAPDVRTAAKSVAQQWPGIIDEDDAEQEIWTRLIEAGEHTQVLLSEMEKRNRLASLVEIGHQIAARERDDVEVFRGNYFYGTQHVRRLLKDENLLKFEGDRPDSISHTEWIDLTNGMRRLRSKNAAYTHLIGEVFLHGKKPVTGGERKELTRAVDALTLEMNRSRRSDETSRDGGPGSRQVMDNRSALNYRRTRNDR